MVYKLMFDNVYYCTNLLLYKNILNQKKLPSAFELGSTFFVHSVSALGQPGVCFGSALGLPLADPKQILSGHKKQTLVFGWGMLSVRLGLVVTVMLH